jgi:hypothetical protein
MPHLNTTISPGLWQALLDYAERTQESLAHIVSKALAEFLHVSHHTLYQVSTATALVEGIYQDVVRVGTLREHGDLGLGTIPTCAIEGFGRRDEMATEAETIHRTTPHGDMKIGLFIPCYVDMLSPEAGIATLELRPH